MCKLRQSERDLYELQGGSIGRAVQSDRRARLEREAVELKDRLGSAAEDLDMRIRCYRETQVRDLTVRVIENYIDFLCKVGYEVWIMMVSVSNVQIHCGA